MKTSSLLLTLAAGAFAASVASAQSSFSEDWSEYAIGTNIIGAEGSTWYETGATTGGIAEIVDSGGNKVLKTGTVTGITTYYVAHGFEAQTGKILAEVDLKVGSGGAEIFLSQGSNPISGSTGSLRVRFAGAATTPGTYAISAFDGALSGAGNENKFGEFNRNKWYRVSITMDINASDGGLSSYSVLVTDLATSLSVGSVSGIDFYGSPVLINAITVGSALSESGTAEWANISVAPAIPEPSHVAGGIGLLISAAVLFARRRR